MFQFPTNAAPVSLETIPTIKVIKKDDRLAIQMENSCVKFDIGIKINIVISDNIFVLARGF